jgi:hypothetical protein
MATQTQQRTREIERITSMLKSSFSGDLPGSAERFPYECGQLVPHLLRLEVEGPQFLRMTPDVCEDALALLDASRSVSIERREIRSNGGNAFKDA